MTTITPTTITEKLEGRMCRHEYELIALCVVVGVLLIGLSVAMWVLR